MGVIKRQGVKNAVISYLGILIGFVSLLIIQPMILSPGEIGLTRILFSFSSVLATMMPLGMINVTIRFFPVFKNPQNNHYGFFPFVLLVTLAGYLLVSGGLFFMREQVKDIYREKSALFSTYFGWVFVLSFFICFSSVISAYCSSNLKTTVPTFLNDIYQRIVALVIFTAYYFRWINLDEMVGGFVMFYGTQFIILFIYANSFGLVTPRIDFRYLREKNIRMMIGYGLFFTLGALSSIGLRYFDSIILGVYMPLSAVGVYSVCAFIPTIIEVPLTALDKITGPHIADCWEKNNLEEIRKTYSKSVRVLGMVSSLIFLMILVNLKFVLSLMPSPYMEAFEAVLIIAAGALVNAFTGINGSILFYSRKYKAGLILLIFLFAATIILDILLIPVYGMIGAAVATSIALTLYNVAKFFYIKRSFGFNPYDSQNLKIAFIVLLLSSLYLLFFLGADATLTASIIFSFAIVAAYSGLLLLSGILHLNEIRTIIKEITKKTFLKTR